VFVARAVAWRSIHNTLVSPAILLPSIIFPLFFLAAFAGGLSKIADVPKFDYRPGYTAFQFVFVFLQSAAFGESSRASPWHGTSTRASPGGCC
jgi:hypothetical protein